MKYLRFATCVVCLGVAASAAAKNPRPIPQGQYVCHVKDADGFDGVVFVQANTNRDAKEAAIGAQAHTGPTSTAVAADVVECVTRYRGIFLDSAATDLLANLVL